MHCPRSSTSKGLPRYRLRLRGFTLLETVLVIVAGLGLLVGGVVFYAEAQSGNRLRGRVNQVVLVANEIRQLDRGAVPMEQANIHQLVRQGQIGLLPEELVEAQTIYSVSGDPSGARLVYFNFQDDSPTMCRRMQAGLDLDNTGLAGGQSSLFGGPVLIRCSEMANGRHRTELRYFYMGGEAYLRARGF